MVYSKSNWDDSTSKVTKEIYMTIKKRITTVIKEEHHHLFPKIDELVHVCAHVHQCTFLFLNWLFFQHGIVFDVGKDQSPIARIIRKLANYKPHGRTKTTVYDEKLSEFVDKYKEFTYNGGIKIPRTLVDSMAKKIRTNCLLRLRFLNNDSEFTRHLLKKRHIAGILMRLHENTKGDHLYNRLVIINKVLVASGRAEIWPFPKAALQEMHITLGQTSCADYLGMSLNDLLREDTTSVIHISTNGHEASITYSNMASLPYEISTGTTKKGEEYKKRTIIEDGRIDETNFKKVSSQSTISDKSLFLRCLNTLSLSAKKDLDSHFNLSQCVFVDPGKKKIYCGVDGDLNTIEFTALNREKLLFNSRYDKVRSRLLEPYREILDRLSEKHLFSSYFGFMRTHLSTLRKAYSHVTFKRWHFRKHCLHQKMRHWMLRHLNGGSPLPPKWSKSDHKRRRQRPKGGQTPRLICWGNGSRGQVRGCQPVPNLLLLYYFSKTNPILIVDEYLTSQICHRCNSRFNEDTKALIKTRKKQCSLCPDPVDRDHNAAINIKHVVEHQLAHGKPPFWQKRKRTVSQD